MKSFFKFFALTLLLTGTFNAYTQCGPLAAPYNQNNGQDGIMFDIVAITSVEITNFDINCGGGTHDFEIWYRPGTHVGFENNAAGWTMIGAANGVTGPVNVATPIPVTISEILCAGDVGAFYITSTGTGSIDYTNGTGTGNVLVADANIQILEGTGKDYAFGASFTPRNPNVTVYYNCLSMSCCAVQSVTAVPGPCNANQYSTTGQINVMNPPATGTLTVTDCNGNSTVINPPFTNPINYTITGQVADGNPCDVTAVFSDDPACTLTENYTAPAPCTTCSIDVLTFNVGSCDPNTNNYMIDGTIDFTDPPTTGTLVIEIDNGTTVVDTVINAPFAGPYNWSISGNNSDGAGVTINAYFSDDLACTYTDTYTAPFPCQCVAQIGTFTPSITGQSTNNYVLCFGDQLDITSNNDNVDPYEMFAPPGPAYDPGIGWLIYSCPPTVALTPNATQTFADDPCFLGYFGTGNFSDLNDGSTIGAYPAGTFTNNTVYFVPTTMYSMSGNVESYVNSGLPCYETGPVYEVQYLDDFTYTVVENCQTGTAEVTVNGSDPAINGSNFTASSLTPATSSFVNTTAPDGGTIQISGLNSNDNYSFDISDPNGCTFTVNAGPFPVIEDPTFDYPDIAFCQDFGMINANITGTGGGTFTATPVGLDINPTTGAIDPALSNPGSYTVTYTTPDPLCFSTMDFTIQINPVPTVDAGADTTICENGVAFVYATGAPSYVWDNDVDNGVPFYPDSTLMYTVIGTNSGGCTGTDSVEIAVVPNPIPVVTPDTSVSHDSFIILNASGGVSYEWSPSEFLSCDDCPNPVAAPDYDMYYCVTVTDAAGCEAEACMNLVVNIECGEVFVPSGFSPNNDGENDELCVYTNCYEQLTFRVYNRWGEKVFESSSPNICWDGTWNGKPLNSAVFVYTVDGVLLNGEEVHVKGNTTIAR